MRSLPQRAVAVTCILLFGQAACGGAQPAPESPSQAPAEPPAIGSAGSATYPQPRAQPAPAQVDSGGGDVSSADVESYEAELQQSEEEIDMALGPAGEAGAKPLESGACERVICRALASMKESAEGICRLSEEDPPRCERARERLEKSEERVEHAGCVCGE